MYCHHCQKSFAEDAKYCSQCGKKLLQHNITKEQKVGIWPDESIELIDASDETAPAVNIANNRASERKAGSASFSTKVTIGFTILVIAISVILFRFYRLELDYNEHVLELQSNAKVAALAGNYEEALTLLDEAIVLRPNFGALKQDQNVVYVAVKLDRMAAALNESIERGAELDAEKKLEEFRQELNGYKEPIFDKHREELEELTMKYTILNLTGDLTSLGSISELGNLLNVVNGLIGEEAETLREQITDRIRTTATAEVNDLLTKSKFTAALGVVDSALSWVKADEVLLELKQKVKQDRTAYELAEEKRIQQAMEEAAAEDYLNQTAAIELVKYEKVMNELGDIVVVAYLKNVATRSIYDISVQYKITDEAGASISEGTIDVMPDYVASGERMSFSVTLPEDAVYEDKVDVSIIEGTWSLD